MIRDKSWEDITLEIDVHDLKGIKIGDWVESVYLKGYFKKTEAIYCF